MRQGTILHGKVKVLHDGNRFVVTDLPSKAMTLTELKNTIQWHFWRGFWYALQATSEEDTEGYPLNTYQDTADFHFAIALAYYQNGVTAL